MNDRQRLEAIIAVVRSYLPPNGISREEAMSQIIALVDPLPAQPEQAPVGMTCKVWTHGCALFDGIDLPNETLLYTAPPSKPWVSLTENQIELLWCEPEIGRKLLQFARAIEAASKELNHG